MEDLQERNQRIIDAVIQKANNEYPGTLAMIGIYGSFVTGDIHEKSDLDLLVLINDCRGWNLGCTFIQDDLHVGHDIYCTTWENLEHDSLYEHPNISKLMDSKIVYCADEAYYKRLDMLRKQANDILTSPFSKKDYVKAENMLRETEHYYTTAMISEDMSDVLEGAGGVVYYVENAVAMLNKQYFHYGTKRTYEELEAMKNKPENLVEIIESIVLADSVMKVKEQLTLLLKEMKVLFQKVHETVSLQKKAAAPDVLKGTYEEMYSNWRNKMYYAAKTNNRHLAFMCLVSLNAMFSEISNESDIGNYNVWCGYDSQNLQKTAEIADNVIGEYLKEYEKAGLKSKHYSDIETFVAKYLNFAR